MSKSAPTRRQISARARSVRDARPAISVDVSDYDPRGHSCARRRNVRLSQTSTVGTPAIRRSRTTTRRRPLPTPATPHDGQHRDGSTVCTSKPVLAVAHDLGLHHEAPHPHERVAPGSPLPLARSEALQSADVVIRRMPGPPTRMVDPYGTGTKLIAAQRSTRRAK